MTASQRQFDTDTTMDAPATGYLGFNNASYASVTAIALQQADSRTGNPDESAWIDTWDDSGSSTLGILTIRSNSDPEQYARFKVTGVTDNTTWYQLTVTYIGNNGAFDADDTLNITFDFYGAAGAAGSDGTSPAFKFTYSTTKTDADPGDGKFRDNNATFSSITKLFIDVLDGDDAGVEVFLDDIIGEISNNRVYAHLYQYEDDDKGNFRVYEVLGIETASGYRKLTVNPLDSTGAFSNNDVCRLQFHPVKAAPIPGFAYKVDLTSETDADPGSGILAPDNSTWASATELYVDNENFEGTDVSASIDDLCSANDNTYIADVWIFKEGDFSAFEHFKATAVEDSTGYRTITVTHVDGSESIADGDLVGLMIVPRGLDSYQPGYHMQIDLGSQTDADPTAGYVRLDNATPASATEAYINDEDRLGGDISTWLQYLGDANNGTRRGRFRIEKRGDESIYAEYWITAATVDGTGYWKVSLEYIAGNGTLTDDDYIVINDWRSGDAGVQHGYEFTLDLASEAISDPGPGVVRFDDKDDLTAATTMIIDALNAAGGDVSGWIETFDDADNANSKGLLKVAKKTDHDVHVLYSVNGDVTNSSGYYQVPIVHVSSDGTLSDSDDVVVVFLPAGDGIGATSSKSDIVAADNLIGQDSENSDEGVTITADEVRKFVEKNIAAGTRNLLPNPLGLSDPLGNAGGITSDAGEIVAGWHLGISNDVTTMTGSRVAGDETGYALQLEVTTGSDVTIAAGQYAYLYTDISDEDMAHLLWGTANAKDLPIAVRFRAPTTGTYCIAIQNAANDRSYVFEISTTADTYVDVTHTVPGDTSGTWAGARVYFVMAAGSTYHTTAEAWQAGNYLATSNQDNGLAVNGYQMRIEAPRASKNVLAPVEWLPKTVWDAAFLLADGGVGASKLADGSVSDTEFQYLNGVTSAIQTQIDGKAASSHTHPASDIGNGDVNDTELSYVNGVTSAIQTQLNAKADLAGDNFTGNVGFTSSANAVFDNNLEIRFKDTGGTPRAVLIWNSSENIRLGSASATGQELIDGWGVDEVAPDSKFEVNGTGRFVEATRIAASGLNPSKTGDENSDPGVQLNPDNFQLVCHAGALLELNNIATTTGGGAQDYIYLRREGSVIATVSDDGAGTVTWGTPALAHPTELAIPDEMPELYDSLGRLRRGLVFEFTSELIQNGNQQASHHPKIKVSRTPESRAVAGVLFGESWEEADYDEDGNEISPLKFIGYRRASGGVYKILVNRGYDAEIGDLLQSNGDGTAKIQADDIIRASTIGKVIGDFVDIDEDGHWLVPVELCGG